MSRFIEFGEGQLINMDSIARVEANSKKGGCTIITSDGKYLYVSGCVYDDIRGDHYIMQLIPNKGKYQLCLKNGIRDEFDYFALCADGRIVPLMHAGRQFRFADDLENYIGYDLKDEVIL